MPDNVEIALTGTANVDTGIPSPVAGATYRALIVPPAGGVTLVDIDDVFNPTLTNPAVTGNAGDLIVKADSSPTGGWIAEPFASVGIDDTTASGTKTYSSSKIGTYVTGLINAIRQVTDPASGASNKVLGWISSTSFGWVDVVGGITRTSSSGWQNITGDSWAGTAPTFATGDWQYNWTNDGGRVVLQVRGKATVVGASNTSVNIPLVGLSIPLAQEVAGLATDDMVTGASCTVRTSGTALAPTASACGIAKTGASTQSLRITFASGAVSSIMATAVYYTA